MQQEKSLYNFKCVYLSVCLSVCLSVSDGSGMLGGQDRLVTHDLCTKLREDYGRQLQGLEPSRMAEAASGHNSGATGKADAI